MRIFVKSIKRLYLANKLELEKISQLLVYSKITHEEYDYITD